MNFISFSMHREFAGFAFFGLPLVGWFAWLLGTIAILRSWRSETYRRLWIPLLIACGSATSIAIPMATALARPSSGGGGAGGLETLQFLPFFIGFIVPSIVVLVTLVLNVPAAYSRRHFRVFLSTACATALLIALLKSLLPAFGIHARFPGVECGFLVFVAGFWAIERLRHVRAWYAFLWPPLTICFVGCAHIATEFVVATTQQLMHGKELRLFNVSGSNAWRCLVWFADEPALIGASIALLGVLLVLRPHGNSAKGNNGWLAAAWTAGIVTAALATFDIIAGTRG